MQNTGGKGLRPVERYIMYTNIDFEYHLHVQLSTTFNITINKPIILTHAMRRNLSTAGPIHIYSRVLLKFHASHGTVQLEFTIE